MTASRSLPLSSELKGNDVLVGESTRASVFTFEKDEYSNRESMINSCGDGNDSVKVIERCQQIIQYYVEECQKPQNETPRWLIEQLSIDEQELAARCSYSYWFLATQQQPPIVISESARFATAVREAIRHINCAEDPREVLRLLKATLEHHANQETWLYRTCMTDDAASGKDEAIMELSRDRRDRIHEEMSNFQTNVVRGHDKEDRAILFAFPRRKAGTCEQAFVDSTLYTIERTLACSEFRSVGRQDQLFVVLDTKAGTTPPARFLQAAVGILQKYYPGRLKGCVIVNAPYVLRGIWKMLKPFVDPVTVQKYIFGPSSNNKTNNADLIADLIDESQAMPALMPGKGRLTSDVDVECFLYEVPFCYLYDEYTSKTPSAKKQRKQLLQHRLSSDTVSSTRSVPLTESSSFDDSSENNSPTECKKEKTKRRTNLRFSLTSRRKGNTAAPSAKAKARSTKTQPKTGVRVSVRTLAVGTLSISPASSTIATSTILPPVSPASQAHRRHW